ncbi:LysR family transcriptional regulator [Enterococcus faecium]|nr:LysR family transcriptional regulator [Enterococcus faecium]
MDIRILTYFLAVAREKNISRAAKSLHITQPTLSKQLKDLEEELGVTLFTRGSREIQLTDSGRYLYSKGKEILSLVEKTANNLTNDAIISGEIYIGGGETKAISFISDSLHSLIKGHPDIQFHLYSGNADDIIDKLDSGLLDFGLVIEPTNKQKYQSFRLPAQDRWGLLIHRNHPLAKQTVIHPQELKTVPLIISRQTSVDSQLAEWLGFSIDQLSIVGTYNLLYNASLMVDNGTFGALALDGIINTYGTEKIFIPLDPPLQASLNLIWKKDQPLSPAARKFLDVLTEKYS